MVIPVRNKRDLSLSSLALLVTLISSALFALLLVTSRSKRTGHLLDLRTGQLLNESAGEFLRPERVLRLLGVGGDQRDQGIGQTGELVLSRRLEEGHRGEINGVGRVGRVSDDDSLGSTAVAVHVDVREEIGRVLEVRVLLLSAHTFAALSLGLIRIEVAGVGFVETALLAVLFYPLGLGLFVGESSGLFRGLGFLGLLGLLALYLGVFGGVPRVENLLIRKRGYISAPC